MSRKGERAYAEAVAGKTGVPFIGAKRKLDSWGEVDDYAVVRDDFLVLFEFEKGQKHPNTNVLKVWPYLDARPNLTIALVQLFVAGAQNEKGSRGRLAQWVADRMSLEFGGRFLYFRLLLMPDGALSGDLAGIRAAVQ